MRPERAIKTVEVFLVLDHAGPTEIIEVIHITEGDMSLETFHKVKQLACRNRDTRFFKAVKEIDQHVSSNVALLRAL